MFQTLMNENVVAGLSPRNDWQQGISNYDSGGNNLEKGVVLPYIVDAGVSYLWYDCQIDCYLDSGIAIHRTLPQSNYDDDSLGVTGMFSTTLNTLTNDGVNLKSNGTFTHIKQRMADSIYRFCLRGNAIRVAYRVPIPKLLSVGGVEAVPDDEQPQYAMNKLAPMNLSGVPVFFAEWRLWYTVLNAPKSEQEVPPNLAAHIRGDQELPEGLQVPYTTPDQDAQTSLPTQLRNPIAGGGGNG